MSWMRDERLWHMSRALSVLYTSMGLGIGIFLGEHFSALFEQTQPEWLEQESTNRSPDKWTLHRSVRCVYAFARAHFDAIML